VLDLGCAGGYVGEALKRYGCNVTGVDIHPPKSLASLDNFIQHDLNQGMPAIEIQQYDYILLLDVIEHLSSPENFICSLYKCLEDNPQIEIIASTGNVAFFITRTMLLFGNFNYGKRGILDLTHTRLFTFSSFENLFTQNSYQIQYECGIPAPYHLALGDTFLSRFLGKVNNLLIKLGKGLFSYQIYFVAKATPSLKYLIKISAEESERRLASLNAPSP
jgi:SAM-dependent methyltransferase